MLATYSLLPVVQAFASSAGVDVETRDISLGVASWPPSPSTSPRSSGSATRWPSWASWRPRPRRTSSSCPTSARPCRSSRRRSRSCRVPGLRPAGLPGRSAPLTRSGRPRPLRPVKGSAVNPVLREGNSDRRAPSAVKNYARSHPHSMGAWCPESQDRGGHDGQDDFRANEQSVVLPAADTLSIRHVAEDGTTPLKGGLSVLAGEVVDATVMRVAALDAFLAEQIARAKAEDVLFSVHLKATMMKVSDPIIFGHVVRAFLPSTFATHGADLAAAGLSANNGLGAILDGLGPAQRGRDPGVDRRRAQLRPAPGHGQLRQGHHQPARPQRRDRRRLDAGDDPHRWTHVGPRRPGGRHPRGDPGQLVRGGLPGRDRRLPGARRLRPDHDGLGAQRGADGTEGRGVRQPRQDLRDRLRRPRRGRQRRRRGPDVPRGGSR
jgi:hypothetical protein